MLNKNKGFKQGTGNTCVAAGLEFAALLFDKKISEGKVLEGLVGNHGLGAIMGIFSNTSQLADDLAKIANQAGLNSEAHIKDIKDAINRGEVVLAPVSVGKNDYHDVVIVGYNEKGYIVYDTDKKGDYVNISEDSVSNMYQVGIKK